MIRKLNLSSNSLLIVENFLTLKNGTKTDCATGNNDKCRRNRFYSTRQQPCQTDTNTKPLNTTVFSSMPPGLMRSAANTFSVMIQGALLRLFGQMNILLREPL